MQATHAGMGHESPERKTYNEAYWEGYDAYYNGYEFEYNPYPYQSVPYGGWYDGWMEAYTDEGDPLPRQHFRRQTASDAPALPYRNPEVASGDASTSSADWQPSAR